MSSAPRTASGSSSRATAHPTRSSARSKRATLEGKLDTGAELSAVPERYLVELDVAPVRTVRAAGFMGERRDVIVYRIDMEIGDMVFPHVEAISTRRPYVILGRNVLRHLVVRFDGPREKLEIRLPKR